MIISTVPTVLLKLIIHKCVCVHYVHVIYALYTYVALLQLAAAIMYVHVHMGEVVILLYIL